MGIATWQSSYQENIWNNIVLANKQAVWGYGTAKCRSQPEVLSLLSGTWITTFTTALQHISFNRRSPTLSLNYSLGVSRGTRPLSLARRASSGI